MIGITEHAAQRLRTPTGRWVAFLVLLAAPVGVVFLARAIVNRIIETELIDFRFFGSEGIVKEPADHIPPEIIESLYYLGFALCAAAALSFALIVASTFIVYGNFRKAYRRRGYLALMLGMGVLVFLALAGPPNMIRDDPSIGRISLALIDNTVGKLPSCDDAGRTCHAYYRLAEDTAESLMRVVAFAFGLVAAAGFAYAYSISLAATHVRPENGGVAEEEAASSRKAINDISLLAAITFLSTIVVAQFLFEPGKVMLDRVVQQAELAKAATTAETEGEEAKAATPTLSEELASEALATAKEAQSRYQHLRNAMSLYWAVIFSIAIAASYFPALIYHSVMTGQALAVESFWGVAKKILTALTPIIGTGVFALLGEIFDQLVGN